MNKPTITYDELEKAAKQVRKERILAGKKVSGIRRKPRSEEEIAALKLRFKARLKKYPPRWDAEKGVLILPYYSGLGDIFENMQSQAVEKE